MTAVVMTVIAAYRLADVIVHDDAGKGHRVSHHPGNPGWHCITCDTNRCAAVGAARAAVVPMED